MPQQERIPIYRVIGRIVDRRTRRGAASLRVEVWDKDLIFNDLVGSTVTDTEGRFSLAFAGTHFREMFADRRPDLFFRVYGPDRRLASTEDSVLWNVRAGATPVEIEIDMPPVPGDDAGTPVVYHRFSGQLLSADSEAPLASFRVRGQLVRNDAEETSIDLGYDVTDSEGRFFLAVPQRLRTGDRPLAASRAAEPLHLRLQIWDAAGERVHEASVTFDPATPETLRIPVPVQEVPQSDAIPIQDLGLAVGRPIPPEVVSALAEREIHTLADVRRAGGLTRLRDLPIPADHPALAQLEAHASLCILPSDLQTNARLIEGGYTSVSRLAITSPARFVEDVGEAIGEAQAQQIHAAAVAGISYLDSVVTGRQADLAVGRSGPFITPDLDDLLAPTCGCMDCEAAVSPAAYLADLVDYIRQYLQEGGAAVDLQALTQRYYQSFGLLPASCGAVELQVRQVRICIEVLRGYLADHPPTAPRQAAQAAAEREYRRAAYLRLLNEIGTSLDELSILRGASLAAQTPAERERLDADLARLAERVRVGVNRVLSFFLDPTATPDVVTETALENLFGLASTTRDPLLPPQPSRLEQWRLERLASLWYSQDWPDDQIPDGRPIIDPDLIGPDDFRAPVPRANPADPERAFDLWLRRRQWVDDRLAALFDPALLPQRTVRGQQVPDYVAGMFAAMYAAVPGLQTPPWQNTQPGDFPRLARDLTTGTRDQVEQARRTLSDDLALGAEAFTRLLELQGKDRRWVEHPTHPPVSAEEWREVAAVLVQVMKRRSYPGWRQEEAQAQQPGPGGVEPALVFGPRDFWFPEVEPIEGAWPPVASRPYIDPERVDQRELPGWLAGAAAYLLWEQRRGELEQIRQRLRGLREAQGLQAALGQALGDPNDPLNPNALPHDLDDLLNRLNAIDPATAETARTQVEQDLYMTVEAFRTLMEIRARESAANQPGVANPPPPPTEDEWAQVYEILTTAEKVFRRYAAWAAEEQNPPVGPLPYWFALKARLPRWRADTQVRTQWQEALRVRSQRPILDPDIVERGDFPRPWPGQAAYDLWRRRAQELDALQTDLRQMRTGVADALSGFNAICRRTLGHDSQMLLDLERREESGHDIQPRLEQLGLTRREYLHLLRLRRLVDAAAPILDSAWSDGEAVLTQVYRRHRSSLWRAEEQTAGITLRPDLFQVMAEAPGVLLEPPPGSRRDLLARLEWRSRLSGRIEQRQSLLDGIARSISRMEEATLPMSRDALIDASDPPGARGTDREARGERLGKLLSIEMRDNGCTLTTRVSQAIQTLQGLIWSVRTGQIRDAYPNLRLVDDYFDERWTWLGSYPGWRAAVFVHLYPENLLIPSLRREQSWGFAQFLDEVRQKRRQIDPPGACEIAQRYADYYADIISLHVEASCHALTNLGGNRCESRSYGGRRNFAYWFGRAPSGYCYWSRYDPEDPESQSLWERIPALENVSALLGAVPFRTRDLEDLILLFALCRKEGADQLLMARYSLSVLDWIAPVELEAPNGAQSFRAVVNQQRTLARWFHPDFPNDPGGGSASVIVQVPSADQDLYIRRVNADGSGWDESDWKPLGRPASPGLRLRAAVPVRSGGTVPYYLFFDDPGGAPRYRIYEDDDHPQWQIFAFPGPLLGAFLWPTGDQVFAFWRVGQSTRVRRLVPPDTLGPEDLASFVSAEEIATLGRTYNQAELPAVIDLRAFNNWLVRATGRSLHEIPAGAAGTAFGASNLYALLTVSQNELLALPQNDTEVLDYLYPARVNARLDDFADFIAGTNLGVDPMLFQEWQRADRLVLANSEPPLNLVACLRGLFDSRFGSGQSVRMRTLRQEADTSVASLASLEGLAVDSGLPAVTSQLPLAYQSTGGGRLRSIFSIDPASDELVARDPARIAPQELANLPALAAAQPGIPETIRHARTRALYNSHRTHPAVNLTYIDEYYYFVPLQLAMELQRNGHFVAALDWYRTVYDYSEPPGAGRKIWYWLGQEESLPPDFARMPDWLLDPLNPHAIARTRFNTYTRFTLLSLIRCFLAYADDEFTRDTAESLARARTLYLTALDLLDVDELRPGSDTCAEVIGSIDVRLSDPSWRPVFEVMLHDLGGIHDLPAVRAAADNVRLALAGDDPDEVRMARARSAVDDALAAQPSGRTLDGVVTERARMSPQAHAAVLAHDGVATLSRGVGEAAANDQRRALSLDTDGIGVGTNGAIGRRVRLVFDPGIAFQFCIPPNPIARALMLRAADDLRKLRTCRNIAGVERQVEPYAAAGPGSGIPAVGADEQLTLPGGIALRPTPYRYEVLIARAKELVQTAAQIEASLLSAIEKRDQELYMQLKARQDIRLAAAGVRLQELRVREAEGAVALAELGRERAEFQVNHFETLISEGRSFNEELALYLQQAAAYHLHVAAAIRQAVTFGAGGIGEVGSALAASSSYYQMLASYDRRRQDWEFQRDLARLDVRIGAQQVQSARDHVQVTAQERQIAALQAEHAEQGAEFIANKFGNAELYDWMSDILEEVYSFFLHQATATARLAQVQLAFERQQVPPPLIRDDYWEVPGEGVGPQVNGTVPDRRGLTGSARLLRDLQELEQFAFDTRQRRLELSRTISLAQLSPFEFARFLETGVMTFATPLEMFDRDFPGHFLRQVKRVRVSVIALVPPGQGIRATLTNSRASRIVIGGDLFQTVRIERGPEQVALTSPRDASGLLDLEPQSELLRPFEGIGVDTFWELRMPKASNPIDYRTIADVLVTIDYTALNSFDYRQQVIRTLPTTLNADRAFSFRYQFADQWYDLHNPELTATPMVVRFRTRREDFPPNLDGLTIRHVVLYFVRRPGLGFEVSVTHLQLTGQDGVVPPAGGASSIGGVISTRSGNAGSWIALIGRSPLGEWELALPNTAEMKNRFKNEEIEDILFVITYSGRTPAWPT